jgi:hypothetical protein
MPIVPFLNHGHLLPPRTSVLGKEVPKDGLRLHLTCNQLIGSTVSTKVHHRTNPHMGIYLPDSQGVCIWLSSKE